MSPASPPYPQLALTCPLHEPVAVQPLGNRLVSDVLRPQARAIHRLRQRVVDLRADPDRQQDARRSPRSAAPTYRLRSGSAGAAASGAACLTAGGPASHPAIAAASGAACLTASNPASHPAIPAAGTSAGTTAGAPVSYQASGAAIAVAGVPACLPVSGIASSPASEVASRPASDPASSRAVHRASPSASTVVSGVDS